MENNAPQTANSFPSALTSIEKFCHPVKTISYKRYLSSQNEMVEKKKEGDSISIKA